MQLSAISLAITRIGRSGGFSPLSLFASGEQGAWFDPSDLSTMFQDSAGTTPVTADGQPVGLILDKSRGLVLGSELVTNGDFSNGSTGWSLAAGWVISNGVATHSGVSGNYITQYDSLTSVVNKRAAVTYTVTENIGNRGLVCISSHWGETFNIPSTVGTHTIYAVPIVPDLWIYANNAGTSITIDNISVKQLAGNHASQATAAFRPLYKTDGTYHWLQFDGVDDSLATANITLNTSQAVTFFSGIHGSGTAQQVLTELGPTHDTTFPAFCCFYPNVSAQYSKVQEQDAMGYSSIDTANGITATKNTFAFAVNIGSTRVDGKVPWYRINGVTTNQDTNSSPIASGGTFAVTPLYIAARAGTSLFFKDKIYSYVLLNRLATTDEITNTETWVNSKTGAL